MRKIFTAALAAFALAPAARAAETKYVVVDSQRVMRDCDECKAAIAAIQKDTDERGKQLEAKGKELETAFADFDKQSAVLSADQKQAKADELQKRRFEWNQAMMKFQEEVNARLGEVSKDVGDKMRGVIKSVADGEQVKVVLDKAAVIWVDPSLDITNEVIRKYNAKYPVKAGAAVKPAGGAKPAAGGAKGGK